jgi:hypothetical protein
MYIYDILDKNLGFSQAEIDAYYKANRVRFCDTMKVIADTIKVTRTIKVPASDGIAEHDSLAESDSLTYRDSAFVKPLEQVRSEIAEKLFIKNYPPDTAFYAKYAARDSASANDSAAAKIDSPTVQRDWVYSVRNNLPDFFVRKFYKEKYHADLPDSLAMWYGEGKLITPADMEVILAWIPEYQRNNYRNDPARLKTLAEWLLKWKLFTEKAIAIGFDRQNDVRQTIAWAGKYEVALSYLEKQLLPKSEAAATFDTAMYRYAYWDQKENPIFDPDTADYAAALLRFKNLSVDVQLDKSIYDLRSQFKVVFLQPDWKDDKGKDPVALLAQADSSRDSNNAKGAEPLYRILAESFPFTAQGEKALLELAKIETENEQYRPAIDHYRRYLALGLGDNVKRCNTFFMIAFIYDEYLGKPEMAEVNYKWVLKNTPDCDLSDDAEFMCLHLDEPMTSVEELRAQALRQGRPVEPDVEDAPADSLASSASARSPAGAT